MHTRQAYVHLLCSTPLATRSPAFACPCATHLTPLCFLQTYIATSDWPRMNTKLCPKLCQKIAALSFFHSCMQTTRHTAARTLPRPRRRQHKLAGVDGDCLGGVIGLVDAHQPISQLKHVVAQRDDDELWPHSKSDTSQLEMVGNVESVPQYHLNMMPV